MKSHNKNLEIITCSYLPDLERCKRLCQSMEQFVPQGIRHTIVVPRRDLAWFQDLANHRRRVVVTEDVLPATCYQLPLFNKLWMDTRGWPIRGWILQQLTKLSANHITNAELILFADSDIQFIRAMEVGHFHREDQLRMIRLPSEKRTGRHLNWHNRAAQLLGVPSGYQGSDYIGQLVSWRRSNLLRLHDHIEEVTEQQWHNAIIKSWDISEYILYGVFVEKILGRQNSGHFFDSEDLCHCCWFQHEADALARGDTAISPRAVALLIQSNLGLDITAERAIACSAMGRSTLGENIA